MGSRVEHVIVGYDIARTPSLTLGTTSSDSTLAEGEIIVLDKYGKLLTAGQTIADSDIIYIGVGGKTTFEEQVTGSGYDRRFIKMSGPIHGSNVKTYKGYSYTAATQRIATCANSGLSPSTTAGAYDYVIRIVYKDSLVAGQTPGQFTQTYRVTSGSTLTNLQALYTAFRTLIAADTNARVSGGGTNTLTLTGLTNTSAALTDIDDYYFVDFDVAFYQVQLTGTGAGTYSAAGPDVTYNTAFQGMGTWQQVRDMEKKCKPNYGVANFTSFPVPSNVSDFFTVINKTYDLIVIEHNVPFVSSDMGYNKETMQTTVIAIPNNTYTSILTDVEAILNTWMASCPGAFSALNL